jgi:hypothetical protein
MLYGSSSGPGFDDFEKSPTSVQHVIRHAHDCAELFVTAAYCKVRRIPQDLRALNLELFALPSNEDFL